MGSQDSEVPRRLYCYICIDYIYDLKGGEELLGFVEIPIILKTLKNLRHYQVANQQRLVSKQTIQQFSLWGTTTIHGFQQACLAGPFVHQLGDTHALLGRHDAQRACRLGRHNHGYLDGWPFE